jgi:hypothetical protein
MANVEVSGSMQENNLKEVEYCKPYATSKLVLHTIRKM